jgi:hypothetical protein
MGGDVIVEAALRLGDRVAAEMSSAPAEIAVEALRNAVGNKPGVIAGLLGRLTVPVVAINAKLEHTDTAALRRHGVETVLMPGVGHFLMMENPEEFNRLLINTVEGSAPDDRGRGPVQDAVAGGRPLGGPGQPDDQVGQGVDDRRVELGSGAPP